MASQQHVEERMKAAAAAALVEQKEKNDMFWYQRHDVAAAPITCDDPVVLQFHLAQIAAFQANHQVQTFGVQDDTHDIEDHFVYSFLGFLHAIYASCKKE